MRSPNRSLSSALLVSLLVFGFTIHAQTLNTTTTLAAETGNNTSAAATFTGETNGNIGATNISKVPVSTLLYAGNNTRIYVHFMAWFGGSNHVNVGYASNDAAQVHRQVDDMMSRGVRGAIVDWYGPGDNTDHTRENQTTQLLRAEAESRAGNFEFAVMEDVGALGTCAKTAGCSLTQQVISDIAYVNTTYFSSPAYIQVNGRPVLFFFGVDTYPACTPNGPALCLDWNAIRAGALGNPLFIFRNSVGYTHAQSDGSFSWVGLGDAIGTFGYLDNFYQVAQQKPGMQTFGSGYKGFNDSIASWGSGRILGQNCGQTWLGSMAEAGRFWSATNQLPLMQLVTWNDYEEGTELESGIDNCVSITASVSGTSLTWSLSAGSENTIDHYTVFASTDGQNLAHLDDVPAGTHAFDLSAANLPAGDYSLYVKAVGRPFLTNKMSAAVSYTVTASSGSGGGSGGSGGSGGGGGTSPSPDIALALSSSSVTVSQGQAASVGLSITPKSGFQGAVSFTCSNLPSNAQCSFAPASLNVSGSAATTTISISTGAATVGALRSGPASPLFHWFGFGSPAFGLMGLVLTGRKRRNKLVATTAVCILLLAALVACGGTGQKSSSTTPTTPPTTTGQSVSVTPRGNYQITVTAVAGTISHSTTVSLAVQ